MDKRSCKALNVPVGDLPALIVSNSRGIDRLVDPNRSENIVRTSGVESFDFVHRENAFCWLSKLNKTSSTLKCNNQSFRTPNPPTYDLNNVHMLAIDWSSFNWYFLDARNDLVFLCAPNNLCKTVLNTPQRIPNGLAVDPNAGLMFVAAWSRLRSRSNLLIKADLDGSNFRVLEETYSPIMRQIVLDFANRHVYWISGGSDVIQRSDYQGSGRKTIFLHGSKIRSFAVFENHLYVTLERNNSILDVNRLQFHERKLGQPLDLSPRNLMMFQRQRQPLEYEVEGSNGNFHHPCVAKTPCQHVCVPTGDKLRYKCVCQSGYELGSDGKACAKISSSQFLIVSQTNPGKVQGYSFDGTLEVTAPILDFDVVRSLDWQLDQLFVADYNDVKVKRKDGQIQTVLEGRSAQGLAVDWIAQNLYWTEQRSKSISVASLRDLNKTVVLVNDSVNPRSITVDPEHDGMMYWSNWNTDGSGNIEAAWLDGSHRVGVVSEGLKWPDGLTVYGRRLFWLDLASSRIESVSLPGFDDRMSYPEVGTTANSFALHQNNLFWSSKDKIMKMNLTDRKATDVKSGLKNVLLKTYEVKPHNLRSNACQSSNTCEDLCLIQPNNGYVCKCRDGSVQSESGSCQPISNWKPRSLCHRSEFQCRNFKCIDIKYK